MPTNLKLCITLYYDRKYEVNNTESRKHFITRMFKKYEPFMTLVDDKSISEGKRSMKEYTTNNSNEKIKRNSPEQTKKEFLNKNDIELLFPGHIRSYYASAEF